MAARDRIKLPSFSNVAGGATATLECPLGKTYDKADFVLGGDLTPAKVIRPRLKLNGKTVQEFASLEEMDLEINKYYNRNAEKAGVVTWWFIRPELDNLDQSRATALGTAQGVQTMHFEFDIDASCANPQIEAFATLSDPRPLGLINIVRKFPRTFATAATQEIDSIPRRGRIAAMHFIKSDVSAVEVLTDRNTRFDFGKTLAQHDQTDYGRIPRAESTVVDFALEGDLFQALAMSGKVNGQPWQVQDFRVKPTIDSPGTVDVLVEYLATFGEV